MYKRSSMRRAFLSLLLCGVLLTAWIAPARAAVLRSAPMTSGSTQNGMVRVRLSSLGNPSTLNLTVSGSYTVNNLSSSVLSGGSSATVHFSASSGQLSLTAGGVTTPMGTAFKLRRHATSGQSGIKIAQGRVPSNLYPGDFYFLSKPSGSGYQLYVIAYIYIEDYLYGVLPYEMGNSSGLEALKAQAVAARTYTMRAMSASSSALWDVVDTTSDQVYSGTPSGNANCKSAVDATKGIVVKNGSSFTATYYTASNGGQTESVKNAWGGSSYAYLTVKDDPYDLANPESRKASFTVNASGIQSNAALAALLSQKAARVFGAGASVTGVTAVTPHTPKYAAPSKLYTKLDFHVTCTRGGQTASGTLTFDIFSELESPLGMNINSGSNELWSVTPTASGFTVYARRYGHGVGMSQRGAMYMARMGYTYDQMLAFYYEGCTRVQYTLTHTILSPVIPGQSSQEEIIVESPAPLDPPQDGTALVSGQTALRSASGSLIAYLPDHATVTVHAAAGDDCLVSYGILCGYVSRAALTITGDIPAASSASPTQLAGHGTVVRSNALNLRAGPSLNSAVITTIPGATVLPILRLEGAWAYTQYGLRAGYVSTDYLAIDAAPVSPAPTAAPTAAPGETPTALTATVTTAKGSLNLRQNPSDRAKVLRTIPQYAVIPILEKGDIWCRTTYGGYTGYVMTKFLTFASSAPSPTPGPSVPPGPADQNLYARVTTEKGSLNLRQDPSDRAKVLRTIPQYETILILEKGDTWCRTTYGGFEGYVMTKFLTFLSPSPTAAPTPVSTPTPLPEGPPTPTAAAPAPTTLYAMVTTPGGSLNLRAEAWGSARVLRTIPQYEIILILEKGPYWCKTTYGGYTGYVMTSFLTMIPVAGTAAPAPAETPAPTMAPTLTAAPTPAAVQTARVVTPSGSLNLRARPQDTAAVLRTIPPYETVIVHSRGDSWCQVTYSGTTGYVMTRFLSFSDVPPVPTATPAPTQPQQPPAAGVSARVVTPGGSLNLRAAPQDTAAVLTTVPENEYVIVTERGASWCQVVYNGISGYVMSGYLAFPGGNSPTAAPSPAPADPPAPTASPAPTPAPVDTAAANTQRDPTLRPLTTAVLGQVVSQRSSLNLRAGCSTDAALLAEIPKYDYVLISAVGDTWCAVQHEGKSGFCLREYLEFTVYD